MEWNETSMSCVSMTNEFCLFINIHLSHAPPSVMEVIFLYNQTYLSDGWDTDDARLQWKQNHSSKYKAIGIGFVSQNLKKIKNNKYYNKTHKHKGRCVP